MRYLPGIAVMRDFEGRYLFANEAWERLQRRPRQDWQGKTIAEVWPPDMAAQFYEGDLQVITQGKPVQTIEEIPQEDGIHNWLVNKFPIPDKDGRPDPHRRGGHRHHPAAAGGGGPAGIGAAAALSSPLSS